ncbi:MAG: hypothetical protein AB1689_13045, partial [Thermodesulfobacteriota bacterium]
MPTVPGRRSPFLRLLPSLALAALVLAPPARADVPGTVALLGQYSVVVLDDLSTSSDVEGRTFVG